MTTVDSKKLVEPLKNDYSQHFVDTGQRPQNFVRDTEMSERFEEYSSLIDGVVTTKIP